LKKLLPTWINENIRILDIHKLEDEIDNSRMMLY